MWESWSGVLQIWEISAGAFLSSCYGTEQQWEGQEVTYSRAQFSIAQHRWIVAGLLWHLHLWQHWHLIIFMFSSCTFHRGSSFSTCILYVFLLYHLFQTVFCIFLLGDHFKLYFVCISSVSSVVFIFTWF